MEKLTEKQAFTAMLYFLDQYYQQTQADDIGALLGSLQLLSDGLPADPAMWDDWLIAVEKVLPGFSEKEKALIH
jgi:hypothetical protein